MQATLTIFAASISTLEGEVQETNEAFVQIRHKKPRSSKFLITAVPLHNVLAFNESSVTYTDGRAAVYDVTGEIEAQDDGSVTVTDEDGDVTTIPSGTDYEISADDEDEAEVKPAKGKGKPAAKAKEEPAPKAKGKGKAKADPIAEALADLDDEQLLAVAVNLELVKAKAGAKMDTDELKALFEDQELDDVNQAIEEETGAGEPEEEEEEVKPAKGKAAAKPSKPAKKDEDAGGGDW